MFFLTEHALVTVVPAVIIEVRLQRLINASVVVALERIIITSTRGCRKGKTVTLSLDEAKRKWNIQPNFREYF